MAQPGNAKENLDGTTATTFQVGKGGPVFEQVPSTDRLKLPNNSRFTPTGSGAIGFVQSNGDGDLSVGGLSAIRDLAAFLPDNIGPDISTAPYREITPAGSPFPTSVIWYESAAKTEKVVECVVTRNSLQQITQAVFTLYDTDGSTVLATATDVITYDATGIFETSRTRTFTP